MAWEWSHTHEAYADAETNLRNLPVETLREIWAEWEAAEAEDPDRPWAEPDFNEAKYVTAKAEAEDIPDDLLADRIWDRASELRTCTNGGHEAHLCPFGCGCHMVPFHLPDEENDG